MSRRSLTPTRLLPALVAVLALTRPLPALAAPEERSLMAEAMAVADRVMFALDLLDTPYQARGTSPETGFDCSGFIGYVFRMANGVMLPRTSDALFHFGAPAVERDALAAGDLLFFRIGRLGEKIDHVGLYLGDGRFVHAPAGGGKVRIDTLALPYWDTHYAGARRMVPGVLPGAVAELGKDSVSIAAQTVRAAATPSQEATP